MLRRGLALALFAVVTLLLTARAARADQPSAHTVPVAVLAFDSEDAEEQADALTSALRSRVRASQGWSLIETTQSLGMLTAALKCPSRPPLECQKQIAEQIKAERYIWGFVQRGPTSGQVTAEVHLYQKNKPDTVLRESYADNLKDPNDDQGVRKIAQRILDRLGGAAVGVVVVHAGDQSGEVIVDGEKHVPLTNGSARLELGAGGHSVEVSIPGSVPTKRNVLVTAGRETVVDVGAVATIEPPSGPDEKPFPTRKVLGGAAFVVGVGLGALAVEQYVYYNTFQDRGAEIAKTRIPQGEGPCGPNGDKEFCDLDAKSKQASAIAIGSAVVGGALILGGAYLFLTAPSGSSSTTTGKRPQIVPTFGRGSGGLLVTGSF